jgi:hypothetical protein
MAPGNSPSIHVLDDDSLLNVFYLYRPFLLGEEEEEDVRLWGGDRQWVGEHWWYKLAHVCQRWRNLILGSSSYLGVCLFCTFGTPVADMLAHSPPLPLAIDLFNEYRDITPGDEQETILALQQRDRVRRIRLRTPVGSLQKLIVAIDEEYPILEYLVIWNNLADNSMVLALPETFQAPHLRHLLLIDFALPIGSRLLTTAVGLVTLCLVVVRPFAYFHPNTLLRWISSMPQLETLVINFFFALPSRDVERQLTNQVAHTLIMAPVSLPNLHHFRFHGVSTYLEALVRRVTTPHLEKLEIGFFNQLTFSTPRLLQFMNTAENLRFESAKFEFSTRRVYVKVYPRGEAEIYALSISIQCWYLDWQVSSLAQIFKSLSQMFIAVEHLTLAHELHSSSSEYHNEVDRLQWRKLLNSFSNVKTLRVDDGLVEELSRCLQLDDGELPLDLLPELQELTYSGSSDTGGLFTSFIDARQNAGRPVTLVRRSPSSDPTSSATL